MQVWFHGGGFTEDSSNQPEFEGSVLAASGDVIIVTVDYRLNIFGFLHTGDARMDNGGWLDILATECIKLGTTIAFDFPANMFECTALHIYVHKQFFGNHTVCR